MRILTGIQPSGTPHLGNYFGMLKPNLELAQQKNSETFIFIADLHALTTIHDAKKMQENTINLVIDFLALGLNPKKTTFYRQSDIIGHTELAWILSTLAPMGLLERCHGYKDKVARGIDANVGLFFYPILQASDILLYDIDLVPVGKDQKQHVEVTRDLGQKFNHIFGETFVIPELQISEETGVLPGLDGQKMSKSYGNTIEIFAEEKKIRKKIMSIKTDSKGVSESKEYKENIIYELSKLFLDKKELIDLQNQFTNGGIGYGDMKKNLAEKIITYFAPFQEKRSELAGNSDLIKDILQEGAKKAQVIASKKLKIVKDKVGL